MPMIWVALTTTGTWWPPLGGSGCNACPPIVTVALVVELALPLGLLVPSRYFVVLKAKPLPVMVICVPPGPLLGEIELIVGAGAVANVQPKASVADCPSGLVTV